MYEWVCVRNKNIRLCGKRRLQQNIAKDQQQKNELVELLYRGMAEDIIKTFYNRNVLRLFQYTIDIEISNYVYCSS